MKICQISHKINTIHLERIAVVYLRQSSEKQVKNNTESTYLQYALVDRAKALGWNRIEVIDVDLGSSASIGASQREGFDRLIGLVAKGEVGIILSREVSRLSRTDKDWCRLLEVCQIFGTLIADAEQIYDLTSLDDQLVLGIKGTMSVVELNIIKMRLIAGMENKARRGELIRLLPPGYVRDKMGMVVKDPNKRIQDAIHLIFKKFEELRSIRQTFLWFHDAGIALPVNKSVDGKIKIIWQLPKKSFVTNVLSNPFYAGVYVFGRCKTVHTIENGAVIKRAKKLSNPEKSRVFIKDHHEGYISWGKFEELRRLAKNNSLNLGQDEVAGAVRSGQGLLSGIMRCGRCGRKMYVSYWGKSGTKARYLCKGDFESGGSLCLGFGGGKVDQEFCKEILKVLSPLGVQASLAAQNKLTASNNEHRKAIENQIKEAEYDAKRAFEQYNEVDPRHRLVAEELERRWNDKLEEVEKLKNILSEMDKEEKVLFLEDQQRIVEMGIKFKDVWESGQLSSEIKKKIIRVIIREVIASVDESGKMLHFVIHWNGGSHTELVMEKPRSGAGQKTTIEDLELIRQMSIRYRDDEIARVLNKLDRRTGKGKRWNQNRVKDARRRHGIEAPKGKIDDCEVLTLYGAAEYCKVSSSTIKNLVAKGILKKNQIAPWAPWEIKRCDLDSEPVSGIIERLRKTGKTTLKGIGLESQRSLF